MLALADEAMMKELGAIDCPTLVLAGELDPYCPPKASKMIADAIPGSELKVVPGAGHCMHWEARDRTNDLILDFIERKGNKK
jgi:pimeloyl-ACP methyl ester carboxylesterase